MSGSPAARRSPPTTMAAGFRWLQRSASVLPDCPAGVVDDPGGGEVSVRYELDHAAERQTVAVGGAEEVDDRLGGGDGLEAAAVPTAADGAVDSHLDMAELAGDACRPVVEAASQDEAGADAGGHHHVDHVGEPASRAEGHLREGAEVGVVVHLDLDAQTPRELLARVDAGPAGHDGRSHRSRVPVERPRERHAGADQAAAVGLRLGEHLCGKVGRGVERRGGVVVDLERDDALGEHRRGEVGDRDADVPVAEVDAERGANRSVEPQENRRSAAAGGAGAARRLLGDHPAPLQVGDERGHGRPREAGQARELAPARRSLAAQRVHDPQAVELTKAAESPWFHRHPRSRGASHDHTFAGSRSNFTCSSPKYAKTGRK